MVLLGAGWTGKAGQEERAGESWSEWGEGTLLGGAEFGTESHEAALTVSLHPGCSCLGNVILALGVQQSESVKCIPMILFFRFPSHLGPCKALSRVPCAIQ